MRKRAGFARALVLDPDIVLFDEPDSGLDPVRTALLCELIQEIHEENGGAYVVITHDIMSAKPRGRVHRGAVEGPHRRVRPGRGALQLRQRVRPPVPLRRVRRARWAWSERAALTQVTNPVVPRPHGATVLDWIRVSERSRPVTIARGAAAGAPSWRSCSSSCSARRRRARTSTSCVFQNAGQLVKDDDVQVGGRRIGSIKTITLTDDNRARDHASRSRSPTRRCTRAPRRSIRADLAVGHREPLHRADARAQQRPRSSTTARRSPPDSTTDVVDLDQLFNTLDEPTARGLQKRHPGLRRRSTPGQRRGGQRRRREYFNPFLSTVARSSSSSSPPTRPRSTDFVVNTSRVVTALAERRDDLTDARRQHEHDARPRSPPRTPSLAQALDAAAARRCAAATRRSSTCARRSTTSTRWSTRPSRRRSDLAPFLKRAAPAGARRASRRSRDLRAR